MQTERSGKQMTTVEKMNNSVNEEMSASANMQEARMYLRQVRDAYRRSEVLCAQADKYRDLATRATGRMDAVRVSGTSHRSNVETYVLELIDTHDKLRREIHRLLNISRQAEELIARLADSRHRAVLQMRYLCAMDWEEVAERLHFTIRWVHKLHREAIAELDKILASERGH